ncbi:MAG: DinB family protein [Bacteroidetes bacterium]|nr:DinB family protein [Bacteroidota bacterium]
MIDKPSPDQLYSYYQTYLRYVPEDDLLEAFISQSTTRRNFLKTISEEKASCSYAEGKWKLKEVVGHLCDTERILSYRALRISRNDQTPLPGFEEDDYVANSNYRKRTLENIAKEYETIRESTISLFKNMSEEMFDRKGTSNRASVSVRDIIFFILAHERHHLLVIQEKYLS